MWSWSSVWDWVNWYYSSPYESPISIPIRWHNNTIIFPFRSWVHFSLPLLTIVLSNCCAYRHFSFGCLSVALIWKGMFLQLCLLKQIHIKLKNIVILNLLAIHIKINKIEIVNETFHKTGVVISILLVKTGVVISIFSLVVFYH